MPTVLSPIALPIGRAGASIQRLFQMTLYNADGTTPAANKTDLWWGWWPTLASVRTDPPTASGTGQSTNASGVFTVNAPSYLAVGDDQGYGIISDQDATPDASEVAYAGTFNVV